MVWIVPKSLPLAAQFDSQWTTEAGNMFFILQSWTAAGAGRHLLFKLGLTEVDFKYRILWRRSPAARQEQLFAIAQSNSRTLVLEAWDWLTRNIIDGLSGVEVEGVELDMAVASRLRDTLPSSGSTTEDAHVESAMYRHFAFSRSTEDLVMHCRAVHGGVAGVLVLTSQRVCFYGEADTMQVSIAHIDGVRVEGSRLFGNKLIIDMKGGDASKRREFGIIDFDVEKLEKTITRLSTASMRTLLHGGDNDASMRSRSGTGDVMMLEEDATGGQFDATRLFFRVPQSQVLIGGYLFSTITFSSHHHGNGDKMTAGRGQVYLYQDHLTMRTEPDLHDFSVTIPLSMVKNVGRSAAGLIRSTGTISVKLFPQGTIKMVGVCKAGELFSAITHHLRLHQQSDTSEVGENSEDDFVELESAPPESTIRPLLKVLSLNKADISSPTLLSQQAELLEIAWMDYLAQATIQKADSEGPQTVILARSRDLRRLIWRRGGIPERFRGRVWPALVGTSHDDAALTQSYSEDARRAEAVLSDKVKEEIERDLTRSLPEHPAFQSVVGVSALRRVLLVVAMRGAPHGYTQAMNLIAALLLLFLPEPQAAAILTVCTFSWLPDTYSRSLLGSAIDQRVFEQILISQFPRLSSLPTVSVVSFSWFLSWFSNVLPVPFALWVLDLFFLEGPPVIYWIGLAVFDRALGGVAVDDLDEEQVIMAVGQVFQDLRQGNANKRTALFESILVIALEVYSPKLSIDVLVAAKQRHTASTLRTLNDRTRAGDLRRLGNRAQLASPDELILVYDVALAAIMRTAGNGNGNGNGEVGLGNIGPSAFKLIARQLIPWTAIGDPDTAVHMDLFAHFAKDAMALSVEQVLYIVEQCCKAPPVQQAALYYDVMQGGGHPISLARDLFIREQEGMFKAGEITMLTPI